MPQDTLNTLSISNVRRFLTFYKEINCSINKLLRF